MAFNRVATSCVYACEKSPNGCMWISIFSGKVFLDMLDGLIVWSFESSF